MLIFIDSNILCSNYRMKGPSFEVAQRVGTIDSLSNCKKDKNRISMNALTIPIGSSFNIYDIVVSLTRAGL